MDGKASPNILRPNPQRVLSRSQSVRHRNALLAKHFPPSDPIDEVPKPNLQRLKIMQQEARKLDFPEDIVQMKKIILTKHDKIVELEYFNSFLQDCLKKKEDLAKKINEDNLKLREELINKEKVIESLKDQVRKLQNSVSPEKAPFSIKLMNGFTSTPVTRRFQKSSERARTPFAESTRKKPSTPELRNFSHLFQNSLSSLRRYDTESLSSRKRTEEDVQRVLMTERSQKGTEMSEGMFLTRYTNESQNKLFARAVRSQGGSRGKDQSVNPRSVYKTVTETQGRRASQSFVLDNFQKSSFLQLTHEDLSLVWDFPQIQNFISLLKQQDDEIVQHLQQASEAQKSEIFELIRAAVNDIRKLLSSFSSMRKLFASNTKISSSLVLHEVIEGIKKESCKSLHCEQALVFIADHFAQFLWRKDSNEPDQIIKLPMNYGVLGYVATKGEPIKLNEASFDPKVAQESDKDNYYHIKSMLIMPIKDLSGNVIGVCQAINKVDGVFTEDDEAAFRIIANQAGVVLKNSIRFDKTLMTQFKMNHLLKFCLNMCEADSLQALQSQAEIGLREIFASEKSVLYFVDEENGVYNRYDDNGEKITFAYHVGIIGQCITRKELIETNQPNHDPNFNGKVDIQTHLPLLTIPIFNSLDGGKVQVIVQVIDVSLSTKKLQSRGDSFESESLLIFLGFLQNCISKTLRFADHQIKKSMENVQTFMNPESILTFGNSGEVQEVSIQEENEKLRTLLKENQGNLATTLGFALSLGFGVKKSEKPEGKNKHKKKTLKESEKLENSIKTRLDTDPQEKNRKANKIEDHLRKSDSF